MNEHPTHRINKAYRKKFLMLADAAQIVAYRWFLVRLIGLCQYRDAAPPKIFGDNELTRAWRLHLFDLVRIYAKRRKLRCGHWSRIDECQKCTDAAIDSAEKSLREWRIWTGG